MSSKGILKDSSFVIQAIFLIAIFIAGSMFSSFVYFAFLFAKTGFSFTETADIINHLYENGDTIREYLFFNTLGTFFFPSIILAKLYSENEKQYLRADTPVSFSVAGLTMASMLAVIPFLNLLLYVNQQIQLPEFMSTIETYMKNMETQAAEMMKLVLYTDNLSVLLINIGIVAVLAAVGEEFLFRGVMQNVFKKIISNHHLIIWIVAVIFSAIHMQFYGFFPRVLLGAYFGYLLYYTKSIWIPVIAHFTNNFLGVITFYKASAQLSEKVDEIGTGSSWWIALVSLCLWFFLFLLIKKKSASERLLS